MTFDLCPVSQIGCRNVATIGIQHKQDKQLALYAVLGKVTLYIVIYHNTKLLTDSN